MATVTSELPGVELPGIYSFEQLMSLTVPPPTHVVDGLINMGQNAILGGYFGVGKTMLAGQLSIALATGHEFLRREVLKPYKVVFLDFETGPGAIRERIVKQLKTASLTSSERQRFEDNWIYVNAQDEECPLYGLQINKAGLMKLKLFLIEKNAEVLIIDNLGWFADADLNDPEDVKAFYGDLRELRNGCPLLKDGVILLLHHFTKPGERSQNYSLLTTPREYLSLMRGSQRLLDFAECRLALAEVLIGEQTVHIINGINRTTVVQPMILQLGSETLSFDIHEDNKLRYNQAFIGKPRQKQLFEALPMEFTWSEAKEVPLNGKRVSPDTLSAAIKTAKLNGFLSPVDPMTRKYRKIHCEGCT